MVKKAKKAFTIVELVIVIAVIAILMAVLIPTFVSLVKKANLSNDQSMIRNMNTTLDAEVIPNTQFDRASDALAALYRNGWNSGKMEAYSNGFHYAYSLESNKMFLLNELDEVIYPGEVDKSTLWGLYYDSVEGTIVGVTKYIAMTNLINGENLSQSFGTTDVTIDLNGYFFGIAGEHTNVTLVNGILVDGTVSGDSEELISYGLHSETSVVANTTYQNTVFKNLKDQGGKAGMTYRNCVFYNTSIRVVGETTFENCTFIDGIDGQAAIDVYTTATTNTSVADNAVVTIKNCTFTNCARAINIAGAGKDAAWGTWKARTVNITGCTFNGTYQPKYDALQIAESQNTTVNFAGNTINSLGNAACIVRYHNEYFKYGIDTENLSRITFSNNTVSASIPTDKYIDLDDYTSAAGYADFLAAAQAKFH